MIRRAINPWNTVNHNLRGMFTYTEFAASHFEFHQNSTGHLSQEK